MTDTILNILKSLNSSATVELSSIFEADIDTFYLENSNMPFVMVDNEFDVITRINQNRVKQNEYKYLISFMNLEDQNYTDSERDSLIIQPMQQYADDFVALLYREYNIIADNTFRYELKPIYHYFNTDLSGVTIRLTFNALIQQDYCLL